MHMRIAVTPRSFAVGGVQGSVSFRHLGRIAGRAVGRPSLRAEAPRARSQGQKCRPRSVLGGECAARFPSRISKGDSSFLGNSPAPSPVTS